MNFTSGHYKRLFLYRINSTMSEMSVRQSRMRRQCNAKGKRQTVIKEPRQDTIHGDKIKGKMRQDVTAMQITNKDNKSIRQVISLGDK